MKFVTIDAPRGGRAGALIGADVLDLAAAAPEQGVARWLPGTVAGILEAGDEGLEVVKRLVEGVAGAGDTVRDGLRARGALRALADTPLLAPLPRPGAIYSAGLNYGKHLSEMADTPKPKQPTAFIKSSQAVIGPGAAIVLPPQCPDMVDFEGEFSFVFGRPCHNVSAADAMDYVAGYTIVNDVSARDWVAPVFGAKAAWEGIHAWEVNIMGKQLPTFAPMGPVLVTKDEIKDPHKLALTTRLDGVLMQESNTDDLVFGIRELIGYFSRWYRFMPGDVFTTGSPAGVGVARKPPVFMKAGSRVEVTVEGIGTLSNPIVAG